MPQEHEVTEKDFFNTIEIAQRFGNLKLNKKFYFIIFLPEISS